MLLALFPCCFEDSYLILQTLCFCYYVAGGLSFLFQFYSGYLSFWYVYGHLFLQFGKVFSMILLKICSWPWSWYSSPYSTAIILRLCLFMVSHICQMFCVRNSLDLTFFDCCINFFHVSSIPEILFLSFVFSCWCLHLLFLFSSLGFPSLSSIS